MLEVAFDTLPYATAGYVQYRVVRSAIAPASNSHRSGWMCIILPWLCR